MLHKQTIKKDKYQCDVVSKSQDDALFRYL